MELFAVVRLCAAMKNISDKMSGVAVMRVSWIRVAARSRDRRKPRGSRQDDGRSKLLDASAFAIGDSLVLVQ